MILTWSQPWRISSRTARRTSETPSATPIENVRALQQWQRTPKSVRRRPSLWPPVGPIARPAMNSRGPGSSPLSVASFRPQSAPPVSRTLVKPRSSILRIKSAARAVISVSGTLSRLRSHDLGQHHMHVAVDQAGHQRAPAAVDYAGLGKFDRAGRDLPDRVAFDHQFVAAAQFPGFRIEHFEILEMVDIHA